MQRRIYSQIFVFGCLLFLSSCDLISSRLGPSETNATDSTRVDSLNAISDSLLARELAFFPENPPDQSTEENEIESPVLPPPPGASSDSLFQAYILEKLDALSQSVDQLTVGQDSMFSARDTSGVAARATELASNVRFYWGRVFLSIVVLAIFFVIIQTLAWTLETLAKNNASRRLLFKRIVPISRILLWSFAIYVIVVYIFEVTGTALLSAGAAIGVALGFAAQDVLKNIFGGLIIIADEPFQVGDKITIGGTYGEVVSIGIRSTRIVTSDDNLVTVPNSQVVEGQVSNANAGQLDCQAVVDLYLPGWVDVTKAKSIAYSAAATSKYVYLDKPIVVLILDDFKEMSLVRIRVKAYVFDCLQENAFKSEITETAKNEFSKHGMLQPFAYNFGKYARKKPDGLFDNEEGES